MKHYAVWNNEGFKGYVSGTTKEEAQMKAERMWPLTDPLDVLVLAPTCDPDLM